jgi:hypothetical protein
MANHFKWSTELANSIADFCEALGVRARPRAAFGNKHRNV